MKNDNLLAKRSAARALRSKRKALAPDAGCIPLADWTGENDAVHILAPILYPQDTKLGTTRSRLHSIVRRAREKGQFRTRIHDTKIEVEKDSFCHWLMSNRRRATILAGRLRLTIVADVVHISFNIPEPKISGVAIPTPPSDPEELHRQWIQQWGRIYWLDAQLRECSERLRAFELAAAAERDAGCKGGRPRRKHAQAK